MYDNPSTTFISYSNQSGFLHEIIKTYKLDAVHLEVFLELEVLDNIPLIHPLGDHAQFIFTDRHTKERENVRVLKVFPSCGFSAESLYPAVST